MRPDIRSWRKLPGRSIAVLGAGVMGCSLALFLARRGARITLIDRAAAPLARASRWNEGKIHLGYLYAGDPSLATARKLVTGGLAFRPLVESLIGSSISVAVTGQDDVFLVHRDSVVDPDAMARYFAAVCDLVRDHPDTASYFMDLSRAQACPLGAHELAQISSSSLVVSGFRVPERSVQTRWLADRFAQAVLAEPNIIFVPNSRVLGIRHDADRWVVRSTSPIDARFDTVLNALWEGRAEIDRTVGVPLDPCVSYRYRLSVFARTSRPISHPNVVIATGPFGDVKNYNGTEFYLSWYPAGLIVNKEGSTSPPSPRPDRRTTESVAAKTFAALEELLPGTAQVRSHIVESTVEGGWVVAHGTGALSDPASGLHQRDRFGVRRHGSYITVDTGKYSTAPWLAKKIAEELIG